MSETPFQKFITLIEFDRNVVESKKKLHQAQEEFDALHTLESDLKFQADKAKENWQEVRKVVDEKELAMKSLDAKELESKERLDAVTNQKEYKSIKTEIDSIKNNQMELEKEIVKAWNNLENAEKIYQAKKADLDVRVEEIRNKIEEKNTTIQEVKKESETLLEKRKKMEDGIPEEWIERYEMMREKVLNPAVPVQQDSCSACFFLLSPQDLQSLRRNVLLQCKGCYRFLFLP